MKLAVILETTGFPKATYMYRQKRFNEPNQDEEIEKMIQDIVDELMEIKAIAELKWNCVREVIS